MNEAPPTGTQAKACRYFCSWGMYAFTDDLRAAWTALYRAMLAGLETHLPGDVLLDSTLQFGTDKATLNAPELLIGQTCGYPLVTLYADALQPLCVPVFDVQGCSGSRYSSAIIVPADSDDQSLTDCAGKTVIINGPDSNSGMNLLRAAVRPLMQGKTHYFSSTFVSGAHIDSLRAVGQGRAGVAAIDCATLALIEDAFPALLDAVRVIGFTGKTTGLPFALPMDKYPLIDPTKITALFNEALSTLDNHHRKRLHISSFRQVTLNDYQSIMAMEATAKQAHHLPLSI